MVITMNVLRDAISKQALPPVFAPMLATLASGLPAPEREWAFEYKWDGIRALVRWDGRAVQFLTRNLNDVTRRYPELHGIGKALGRRAAILDAEIIALDEEERPSFAALQKRMHVGDARAIARLVGEVPVSLVVFDLLHQGGQALCDWPWAERRERLEKLGLAGASWLVSPAHVGKGKQLLAAARKQKLEGVMAKRVDSPYLPGARSRDWLKIKIVSEEEFVIGGWVPEGGTRTDRIGSILLGQYDERGLLRFAGGVGTGFGDADHQRLTRLLKGLHRPGGSPFADPVPRRGGALFVVPELVAQIEYRRRPAGIVQQGAFKGLRTDKGAREVTREEAQ